MHVADMFATLGSAPPDTEAQRALVLPLSRRSNESSSTALLMGEQVFQSRYLCHNFLGSWKWDDRSRLWNLRRQWREQFQRPCH